MQECRIELFSFENIYANKIRRDYYLTTVCSNPGPLIQVQYIEMLEENTNGSLPQVLILLSLSKYFNSSRICKTKQNLHKYKRVRIQ